MHHNYINNNYSVYALRIVAVSNKLTQHGSIDNKHLTNCFISHTIN